ncbi:MAG: hypothetical protein L0Z53_01945, partial [Acidobacteriales bacterium]|nr:hypothetical protein [Terriglobales bacterium]
MTIRTKLSSMQRLPSLRWPIHPACCLTVVRPLILLVASGLWMGAQQSQAPALLAKALHFADLYNWADAAPAFTEAEKLFAAAGDQRNTLYARLGRIRSNVEREQQTLPMVSAQLAAELEDNPLLQSDSELRMFCLIVKGDLDTEINTGAMRQDWQEVQTLAVKLGITKWQYRALAQLGLAAFYDADIETARKNVGTALAAATKAGDAGAQIRFLTMLATGLVESRMYEQALPYLDNALKIASATPGAGYQFPAQQIRIYALIGLKQLDAAQRLADEVLTRARETRRTAHETTVLGLAADIAQARNDRRAALSIREQAVGLAESAGLTRVLATAHSQVARLHRQNGELEKAEHSAAQAAEFAQASGDTWAVPQRLQTLAELQVARGRYGEADRVYDRAEAFVDSMIGGASTVFEKTALIRASSEIYTQHFALIAEQFKDSDKAYAIIEQVRGR